MCNATEEKDTLVGAPGDMCGDNVNGRNVVCYGSSECKGGVCKAADSKVGASCAGVPGEYETNTRLCAPGQFCNFVNTTCMEEYAIGDNCTT